MRSGTRWFGRSWRLTLAALLSLTVLGAGGLVWAASPRQPAHPRYPPPRAVRPAPPAAHPGPAPAPAPHPIAVQPVAGVAAPAGVPSDPSPSSSEPEPAPALGQSADGGKRVSARVSDAQIRHDLRLLRQLSAQDGIALGPRAAVGAGGMAAAPSNAPSVVVQVIQAGNQIARTPYLWGGGHGAWADRGYDCSGSVSFALAGAGLLDRPLDSTAFERWGDAGPGRWITVYANSGHAFMMVAGLRFDTGALGGGGSRWQRGPRSTAGFVARHPPGL